MIIAKIGIFRYPFGEINQLSKRKMATTNGVQANAGKALFKEASENPKKLKSQAASNQSKEKEVAVTFGVQQLNQLGEAMATIDGLELDKMQKVFQNFPFDRSGVTAGLKDRILEKYPKAAEVQEKPNQQRELVRRKGSTGSVARKYIVQTGGNTSLRSSTLKAAFLEWAESPSNRTEDDSEFIYSVAEWAIKQTSDEVINKCQAFFENLPAEKTVGFTEEQKQVITIFRLEKEFGDVEALESMERAKEFAWVHFSDAIEEKEFAGKQRVLHSLVAQKDEGLLGVIGTLMGELRKLQKEYYAKNHYIAPLPG